MGQIAVDSVKKYFGIRALLDGVSFIVGTNDRIGLVGANGTGKTTLIKIIVGDYEADNGSVMLEPGKKVGYFAQDRALDVSEESLINFVREGFSEITKVAKELEKITDEVSKSPNEKTLLDKLSKLQSQYESLGGYDVDHGIERILSGLSFPREDWKRPVSSLSGGERARLHLARTLSSKPDTLILDEPTNHLDLDALMWLEQFLQDFNGSVLIVSHDRYMLDKVCNKTVILIDSKAYTYNGNFTFARNQLGLERKQAKEKLQEQLEFVEKANRFIKRFKGYGTEIAAKRARSMERRLERVEFVDVPPEEHRISLQLGSSIRTGEVVFKTKHLVKRFQHRTLFDSVDIELKRGQKVALMGPNGCGKTTFLKIVMGFDEQTSGDVWTGYNVSPVYLEQELGSFEPEATVLQELMNHSDLTIPEARDHLATFLFRGDDVFKTCKTLSGGEVSRLILSKLALIDSNFLVLDEPTNHLDINARAALEDTIRDYTGTVLIVSHDRYFIKNIGATIWAFDDTDIIDTRADLESFLNRSQKKDQSGKKPQKPQTKKDSALSKNQLSILKKELSEIETKIHSLEAEKTSLERSMSNPSGYINYSNYDKVKSDLENLIEAWTEKSNHLHSLDIE